MGHGTGAPAPRIAVFQVYHGPPMPSPSSVRPEPSVTQGRSLPRLVVEAIRVKQWMKNLLIFAPLLLAHHYTRPGPLLHAALGFVSFSLGASAVYVLNDMLDVEADRHHPRKRRRPFASGELPLRTGFVLIPVLLALSLVAAWPLPRMLLLVLGFYFVVTTLYSFALKEIALLDVLVLAGLYTTRVLAGAAAVAVPVSEWLLALSMFLFLSLAAVKRYAELRALQAASTERTKVRRRGYYPDDGELILLMGVGTGLMAVLVLALYITSDAVTRLYRHPQLLWLVCPLLLYWVSRVWLLAHRGELEDDPLSFAVRDRATWLLAVVGVVITIAATGAIA